MSQIHLSVEYATKEKNPVKKPNEREIDEVSPRKWARADLISIGGSDRL